MTRNGARSGLGIVSGFLAVAGLVVACGGSADAPGEFPAEEPTGASPGAPAPGSDSGPKFGGGGGGGDAGSVNNECAAVKASAKALPLEMIVVLDKSGSMCEYTSQTSPRDCGNPNSKWKQVTKALEAFFRSFESSDITISLIAFPTGNECSSQTYQTPIVVQKLPDLGSVLATRMNAIQPSGSTPTQPAVAGAVAYAKTLEAKMATGGGKPVIVLATDGIPEGCSGNSIQSAGTALGTVASTIKTYVIGVGGQLGALDALAVKGGTQPAFLVSNANPAQVSVDLTAALSKIRGASLACEYTMPAAPPGQQLDVNKVNVQFTVGTGSPRTLLYSADCANPDGWKYDNAQAPTKIVLCQASCDSVKAANGQEAKLDVVLGCKTEGGTPR